MMDYMNKFALFQTLVWTIFISTSLGFAFGFFLAKMEKKVKKEQQNPLNPYIRRKISGPEE
jgi:hypothetical protein